MGKLSGLWGKVRDLFKSMSMGKKIALGTVILTIIILAVVYKSYSTANKYGVLFSNLSAEDGKTVSDKLDSLKVDKQVKGSSIYVPKDQVDELRLQLASSVTDGSKGYELLDNQSSLGMTDEEFNLEKVRIAQGELEKTIKSFSQVSNARVHITPASDSVFTKDATAAKASIYVQLKTGMKLSNDNVKSIIALVSGAVENLPKENIEVIDDKMNLLSKDVNDESQDQQIDSQVQQQQSLEKDFQSKLESEIKDLLEPVVGADKVKVTVNADLDFDSKQNTTMTYDPNKVEESTHIIKENTANGNGTTSASPVDNNMSNTTSTVTGNTVDSKDDQTINYKVGQSETKTITAPGAVKRLTASVVINGKLDTATQTNIQKLVQGAIGFDQNRGDSVNVMGMTFDSSANNAAQAEIDAMKQEAANKAKIILIATIAAIALAVLVVIIVLVILLRKRRKKKKVEEEITSSLDVVIGDELTPKETISFEPLDLEIEDERSHIENEIKRYATDKPDQVADIIKSWLSEDEG